MAHIGAHEDPKIVVREHAAGVRGSLLCAMVSMVHLPEVDTKFSGWALLGRELWGLNHQLSGAEWASTCFPKRAEATTLEPTETGTRRDGLKTGRKGV